MESLFENLKNQIINDINNNQLPIDAKYYLFKDIMRMIEDSYQEFLSTSPTPLLGEEKEGKIEIPIDMEGTSEETKEKFKDLQNSLKKDKQNNEKSNKDQTN